MGEVYVTDAPGGDYQVYQCPNCSRYYPAVQIDDQGLPKIEFDAQGLVMITVDPPDMCRRCHSPMDIEASKPFQRAYGHNNPRCEAIETQKIEDCTCTVRSATRQTVRT